MSSQLHHAASIALILVGCFWMSAVSGGDAFEGDEAGDDEAGDDLLCE